MNVRIIDDPPEPDLSNALAEFERQFTYPLGSNGFFRIEHSADYARFYRSIGAAQCFVAGPDEQVQGVISAAMRSLLCPDKSEMPVCYLGDLKIAPDARGGRLLLHFRRAIADWLQNKTTKAYGIVMDGSARVPSEYSGRAGIPKFAAVAKTMIMRISCEPGVRVRPENVTTESRVRELFRHLSVGRYASLAGNPDARSVISPVWLATPEGTACGCLEDTRKAKRLVADNGVEMNTAHLSSFAFSHGDDGAALILDACARAAELNCPALFVAVAESDAPILRVALGNTKTICAPATIYAHDILPGTSWNINSSEI